jgi:isopenicillin N synthase-like dioxygenase
MTNFTTESLECDDIDLEAGTNHLYSKKQKRHMCVQFGFLKFTKYGIPQKDKFHASEESRRVFEIPIPKDSKTYLKLKELDERLKVLLPSGGEYTRILKEPENHPPLIKLKIKKDSKFWKDYAKGVEIKWDNSGNFRDQIKFHSDLRFVVKPKWWEYLGKVGVSLVLRHLEVREPVEGEDGDVVMDDVVL